ncbi:MAG: hypothetical protein WD048_15800 [Chitinophagales bacterium]
MQSSQLIQSLKYLNPDTFKRFGAFVHSPYHNTNEKLQKLYSQIAASHPDLTSNKLDKKTVYPTVFLKEKFNGDKLRAMMSLLLKLLKEFLVIEQIKKSPETFNQLLLEQYQNLGMNKQYDTMLKKSQNIMSDSDQKDTAYFLKQHLLDEKIYDYAVQNKTPNLNKDLQNLLVNLDIYYAAKRLKYSCEALNRKNIAGESFEEISLMDIKPYSEKLALEKVPLIDIYLQIFQTLEDENNESNFEKLVKLLEENSSIFPAEENKVMYGYAMNFCIKKINEGRNEYLEKLFKLYKLLLEFNIIFEGKYISQWDYKNIVTVGLRLNEIEWTEYFINHYEKYLNPNVRDNAFKYNLANLSYFKKDFSQTMELLREVEFTEISYELSSKSLLLKSYYELNEFNALFAQAETFKLFLRRNKRISDYQKTIYKNLIRYIVKLAKLKSRFQKVPKKVRDEIESTAQIADKSWLLKKIKENTGMEMY